MFKKILLIILGGVVFSSPALFNGFPLVTADTGTYIISGFRNFIPVDRPVFYGYFLRHFSLKESLWIIIFIQGGLVSYLLYLIQKKFLSTDNLLLHLATCILLTYFTCAPWYISQVMPDIFTATGILCFALYVASPVRLNAGEKIFTIVLFLFSILVHNSNLLVFTIITLILIPVFLIKKGFRKTIRINNFIVVSICVFISWWIKPTVNYFVEDNFSLSGSSHVFFMGRMVENGVLKRLLKKECTCVNYKEEINSGQPYIISYRGGSYVAGANYGVVTAGAPVVSWHYAGSPDQKVYFIKADSLFYKISPSGSKDYFYAVRVNVDGSNELILEPDTGSDSQLFKIEYSAYGYLTIISKSTNLCFDFGENAKEGAPIRLKPLNTNKESQIRLFNSDNKSLCLYQEALRGSAMAFMWDYNSPFYKTGGFLNSREEYNYWISKSFTDPQILLMQIGKSAEGTFQQIIRFQNGDGLISYGSDSSPAKAINECFPNDTPEFTNSKQYYGQLFFQESNNRYNPIILLSLIILLIMLFVDVQCKIETKIFAFIIIVLILLNAWVCGTFANAVDRLQARIIWCFPYVVFLLLVSDRRVQRLLNKWAPNHFPKKP